MTATECQTPGAVFHTSVAARSVGCRVDLPFALHLTEAEAGLLEANLHNAVELVLARYFPAVGCIYMEQIWQNGHPTKPGNYLLDYGPYRYYWSDRFVVVVLDASGSWSTKTGASGASVANHASYRYLELPAGEL